MAPIGILLPIHDARYIAISDIPANTTTVSSDSRFSPFLVLPSDGTADTDTAVSAAAEQCEQTYGFLPCTMTVFGNPFLVLAYGFLMFKAATYLSTESELLLEILGPGIVGGLFLSILDALSDAMLILVFRISGARKMPKVMC